jgi:acyl-coenzyme A synthetase/AMP-(fatty) acid ligase/acyl carrier protein
LFTSGTTGVPKGVVQTHRNVLHHTRVYTNALHISHEDHLTLFSGFGFDAAVMDILGALLNGACLHPLELRAEGYPGEVLDHMAEAAVTILHATPTVFRFLMRSKVCRHELQSVRAVVLGGEAAQVSDFELFCKQFTPPAVFVNGLGPSESTTAAQFFADHNTRLRGSVVPVGKAVEGTELLLLDAEGQQTGMVGELAVRSPFVAKGYWGQPELTAERFVVDPEKPGARIYRTGDQVRRLPDGSLVFLGRIDKQVKLRGHRIEPSEIEAVLARQAGVEKVVVILSEASGAPELLAYYEGNAAAHELHRALKAVLPTYMVPAAFVAVRTLSFKANGKLDVGALPVPQRARDSAAPIVAPRTSAEKQLVKIWSDVLGVAEIGVHDDFFELGGHSLLAAQLAARVNESMQVAVPLRRLFDGPTVAQVAEHVEALQWAMNGAAQD